jgi:DNA-binding transcriptional regulator of glucitol operon
VLRRFLSPRWLAFHLLVLVLAATFLGLGWWQLRRATSGNALSWGYALQWPVFAGFTVFVWCRTLRDTVRPPGSRDRGSPDPNSPDRGSRSGSGEHPGGGSQARATGRRPAFPVPDLPARPAPAAVAEDEDPELAAYNRYLAALAEADRQQ